MEDNTILDLFFARDEQAIQEVDSKYSPLCRKLSYNTLNNKYENISFSVQEGGYIKTNILDTGKLFYIGEDKTQSFVDYVTEHCEGYELVTVYTIADPVPE